MIVQTLAESSCVAITLAYNGYITASDSLIAGVAYGILSGAAKLMTREDDTLIGKAGRACGYLSGIIAAASFAAFRSNPIATVTDYNCVSDYMGQAGTISLADAVLYGAKPICKSVTATETSFNEFNELFSI